MRLGNTGKIWTWMATRRGEFLKYRNRSKMDYCTVIGDARTTLQGYVTG